MVFKKMLSAFGVGGPSIDTQVQNPHVVPGGRVTGLRLVGVKGSTEVLRELPVRRLFQNLSSGLFVLDVLKNDKGEVHSLSFTGGGWGHGVGMCQMGAIGRAERGQSFKQILDHYYGGAVVEDVY